MDRSDYRKSVWHYKYFNGLAPQYMNMMKDLFQSVSEDSSRSTRNSGKTKL